MEDFRFTGLTSRTAIKKRQHPLDANQSDPTNTDTTQEDPTVDSLTSPSRYTDAIGLRPKKKIKNPKSFLQATPMNVDAISDALTAANKSEKK